MRGCLLTVILALMGLSLLLVAISLYESIVGIGWNDPPVPSGSVACPLAFGGLFLLLAFALVVSRHDRRLPRQHCPKCGRRLTIYPEPRRCPYCGMAMKEAVREERAVRGTRFV